MLYYEYAVGRTLNNDVRATIRTLRPVDLAVLGPPNCASRVTCIMHMHNAHA